MVKTGASAITNCEDRRLAYDGSAKVAEAPVDRTLYGRKGGAGVAVPDSQAVSTLVAIDAQTTTAYTLLLADKDQYVRVNNAAANTVTIPANVDVAFAIGTQITVRQAGARKTTIAGAACVTVTHW